MTRIVSRAEWGARPPKSRRFIELPSEELWLHHSAGALDAGANGVWWDDVRGIQDFHMRPTSKGGRGWSDIAYSFIVGGGQIFEGRGVGVAGGHTAGRNRVSHAICVIGDYSWMTPQQRDLEAVAWLIRHGREQGWWTDLTGPHADAPGASTACCGQHLIARIPDLRRMAANPQEDDDMPLSDDDLKKITNAVWLAQLTDTRVGIVRQPARTVLGDIFHHARVAAAKQLDVPALAEALAARMPAASGPVKVADLEEALRRVLGSLDD